MGESARLCANLILFYYPNCAHVFNGGVQVSVKWKFANGFRVHLLFSFYGGKIESFFDYVNERDVI